MNSIRCGVSSAGGRTITVSEKSFAVLQVVGTSLALPFQVLPFARGMRTFGYDVDVASPPGPEADDMKRLGFRHIPFQLDRRLASPLHLRTAWQLRRILRAKRYGIVHFHGPITGLIGRMAARGTGARVVYHCRGGTFFGESVDVRAAGLASRMYPRLERSLSSVTDLIFTLNRFDAEDFVRQSGYRQEQVVCLGVGAGGVDTKWWDRAKIPPQEISCFRTQHGIPTGVPVIGFVGRVVREKGVIELIEAFRRVRRSGFDAILLVVGGTPSSERDTDTQHEFRRRVVAYGLSPYVIEVGQMVDPRPAFMTMDVLCLPSHREGFGQVIAEGAALGIPAVAAATRGSRQAIIDGVTGHIVPKGDVEQLSRCLVDILNNDSHREALGAAAKRRVHAELHEEIVLERVLSAYRDLLHRRGVDSDI